MLGGRPHFGWAQRVFLKHALTEHDPLGPQIDDAEAILPGDTVDRVGRVSAVCRIVEPDDLEVQSAVIRQLRVYEDQVPFDIYPNNAPPMAAGRQFQCKFRSREGSAHNVGFNDISVQLSKMAEGSG